MFRTLLVGLLASLLTFTPASAQELPPEMIEQLAQRVERFQKIADEHNKKFAHFFLEEMWADKDPTHHAERCRIVKWLADHYKSRHALVAEQRDWIGNNIADDLSAGLQIAAQSFEEVAGKRCNIM